MNSIAIYDDRVEIGNPGIFPSQITPENIKGPHDSYPYNVKMAEVLYRSMWLENWGSGARRIMEACEEQGVEEPTWRWDGGFVYVTFKRPGKNPNIITTVATHNGNPKETGENPKETDVILRNIGNRNLSKSQKDLLRLIIEIPSITLAKMAEGLNLTVDKVRTLMKNLEKEGVVLCRKGATKKGVWEIKFE